MGHRHRSRGAGPSVLAGLVILAVCLAGCRERERELAPVRGTVYHEGKPLAGGTIVFAPDADRGGHGPLAVGEIHSDGTFTLHTGDRPGAVPGWHRITVMDASPRADPGQSHKADRRPRLPLEYSDPDRSGQRYEVEAGRSNVLELHLD
jgi:hypothetical protein